MIWTTLYIIVRIVLKHDWDFEINADIKVTSNNDVITVDIFNGTFMEKEKIIKLKSTIWWKASYFINKK